MPGLLDILDDPMTQMGVGLLGGTSPFFGPNVANAFAQMQANRMEQMKRQMLRQQIESGGLDLQQKKQSIADQDQLRQAMQSFPMPQDQSQPVGQNFMGANPNYPQVLPGGGKTPAIGAPQANSRSAIADQYDALASRIERQGTPIAMAQAEKYREIALKMRPKLKDEQVRLQNGTPVVVRNYEDGSTEVSPFNPTAKVNYLNTGGQQTGINEYTGLPTGNAIRNTMTPGEAASNARENTRLFFETGMGPGAGTGGAASGAPGMPGLPAATQVQLAKSQAEALNKGGVDYKTALDSKVKEGIDLSQRAQRSLALLDQFRPGLAAPVREDLGRRAAEVLAPFVGEAQANKVGNGIAGGNIASMQEFEKMAATQAMESLKQAMESGRITQSEFKIFKDANPSIAMNREAIKNVYNFMHNITMRDYGEQQKLNDFIGKGGNISQWPAIRSREMLGGGNDPLGIR